MYATVQTIEGITEAKADKLAALGMVSVFDIEEVGIEVLMTELEIDEAVAKSIVETCAVKSKEVSQQQAKDKEEKERKTREDADVAQRLFGEGGAVPEGTTDVPAAGGDADSRAADILGQG